MNIALLPSAELSWESGSIVNALILLRHFLRDGHAPRVLAYDYPREMTAEMRRCITLHSGVMRHPVITDRDVSDDELATSFSATLAVLKSWHREQPLEMIVVQYLSVTSCAAVVFGQQQQIPVIVMSFGRDIYQGMAKDARYRWFATYTLQGCQGIICANHQVENHLAGLLESCNSSASMVVIPPALDDHHFSSETQSATALSGSSLVLVSVNSAFSEEKGIPTLLLALDKVRAHFPSVSLYLVGDDDSPGQPNLHNIQQLIAQLSLQDNVILPGFLGRQAVASLLLQADIFIDARLTSNFSSALLEAQWSQCAIICSRTQAAEKIIKDGENGLLFTPQNEVELSQLIMKLAVDVALRTRLSQGCARWKALEGQQFSENDYMRRTYQFYYSV